MKKTGTKVSAVIVAVVVLSYSQAMAGDAGNAVTLITLKHAPVSECVEVCRALLSESAKIAAAPRINGLFLRANPEELAVVKYVVAQYDQPVIVKELATCIPLRHARPSDIVPGINGVLKEMGVVAADDRSGQLLCRVKPEAMEAIERLVKSLDVAVQSESKPQTSDKE
jgi:type II secretory pathway component GspD/PulD (secretin)